MKVSVVGAGVIGLTSAIRLREAGHDADIVAAELPTETVASSVAGAIWYPYRTSQNARAAGWSSRTLEVFTAAAQAGLPGVAMREAIDLLPEAMPDPWWADQTRGFRRPEADELRPSFVDGWIQETAVIDVVPHLRYLVARVEDLGGSITQNRLESLQEVTSPTGIVVNCSGVGAADLVGDEQVYPIRGQVVRVRGKPVPRVSIVERGPLALAYVIPHGEECVVGGTTNPGAWDRLPDDAVTDEILEKATLLEPGLAHAEVLEVKVGLRPGRPRVRLEYEAVADTLGVIHNYGHAGNGWSLSWGCAEEVVRIVDQVALLGS